MPTKWQLMSTSLTEMSLEYEQGDKGKMNDDRLLLGLRQSSVSRPVQMLGFPMLCHGIRLISDHVAPLVGAKQAGVIVHAEMCVKSTRIADMVSAVWTEDLLYHHPTGVDLSTTQCPDRMKGR